MNRFRLKARRLRQILYYGWIQSKDIARKNKVNRWDVYLDMIHCYRTYHLWSNQYSKENFFTLPQEKRDEIGKEYKERNDTLDNWPGEKLKNIRFLKKWKDYKWELSRSRNVKRNKAYAERYNMGSGCYVSYDVILESNHFFYGKISIGNNVLLSKHVYIDFTGDVTIEDGVKIANGVIIESHHRDLTAYNEGRDVNIPTKLIIRENAYIGSRAIILDSCNYIGKNARIGAGAVVTKDIPDNAVAVGTPAKVVKILTH